MSASSSSPATLQYLTLSPIPITSLPSTSSTEFIQQIQHEAHSVLDHPHWHTPAKVWHKGLVTTQSLPLHSVRFAPAHHSTSTPKPEDQPDEHSSTKKKHNTGWFGRSKEHHTAHKEKDLNEEGIAWHKRTTVKSSQEYPFELYHDVLGTSEHVRNERNYILNLVKVEQIGDRPDCFIKMYELPFGTTNRSFLSYIIIVDTTPTSTSSSPPLRSFLCVALPIADDAPQTVDKGFVRGRYVAVEEVKEILGKDGEIEIEWRCASMSDPGGSIPVRLAESATASTMANAVPPFYEWLAKRAPPPPARSSADSHDRPNNTKRFSMSALKRTLSNTLNGSPTGEKGEEVKATA